MKHHTLKTWPIFFGSVWAGVKLFEFRRNDRGFCAGDRVTLQEWTDAEGYTGREIDAVISYVLADDLPGVPPIGLTPGFCVFGLADITQRLLGDGAIPEHPNCRCVIAPSIEQRREGIVIPFPARRVENNEGDSVDDGCVPGPAGEPEKAS